MIARGKFAALAFAALAVGAGLAGCKDKESLVVVTVTAGTGNTTLTSVRVGVGAHNESFSLTSGVGIPYDGVSFGVYVPSSISGPQTITVVGSQAQSGNCALGAGQVDIKTVGQTYGPIVIDLSATTGTCPSGGTGGTGGRGTGGSGGGFTCTEYDHGTTGVCATTGCYGGSDDFHVYGAVFSPVNAGLAVTSGTDGRTKVWTVSNGAMTAEGHVLTGGTGFGEVAFSPDGTLLAIGQDGGIQIVSTSTWTLIRTLTVANFVYGVGFSPDGTQVISLDTDESTTPTTSHLNVHAVTGTTALHSATLSEGWALGVSPVASASGLPVAVTTQTGGLLVYMLTSAGFSSPTTMTLASSSTTIESAQFSPSGTLMAAGGDDGVVQFWSLPLTGSPQTPSIDVSTVTNGTSDWVGALAFSPDGSQLALGGSFYGSFTTFATASRAQVGGEQDTSQGFDVYALGYSRDGKYVIGGESNCGCVFLCH